MQNSDAKRLIVCENTFLSSGQGFPKGVALLSLPGLAWFKDKD